MATQAPGPGGEKPQDPAQIPAQPVGKSHSHQFTDETHIAPSHSTKVPQYNFRNPGGLWEHQASQAWEKGIIDYIMLIISYYCPSLVTMPSLFNSPQRSLHEAQALIQSGKGRNDPKVEAQIGKIIYAAANCANDWNNIKAQSPNVMRTYLHQLEGHYEAMECLLNNDLLTVSEGNMFEELDMLRKEVARHLGGRSAATWGEKFAALQQFSVDKDPMVLFNFHRTLHEQILKQQDESASSDIGSMPALQELLNDQTPHLQQIEQNVEQEIAKRLTEVQKRIENRMPSKALQDAAQELNMTLPKQGFLQQLKHFQEIVAQTIQEAKTKEQKQMDEHSSLQKELLRLQSNKEDLERGLDDKRAKLEQEQAAALATNTNEFSAAKAKVDMDIQTAKSEIQTLENDMNAILKGNIVENFFQIKRTLSTDENFRVRTLNDSLDVSEAKLRVLEAQSLHLKAQEDEQTNNIKTAFAQKIQRNKIEIGQLEQRIETLKGQRDSALKTLQSVDTTKKKWEDVQAAFNQKWEKQHSMQEMVDDCILFMKLSFFETAFKEFRQAEKNESPTQVLKDVLANTKASFTKNVLKSLSDMGVSYLSRAYQETENAIPYVVPLTYDQNAKSLGLEEFQKS